MKAISSDGRLAAVLHAFFLERLVAQRNASPQTVAAYRDSFRLLLQFAHQHVGKAPERLDRHLDPRPVLDLLEWQLQRERERLCPVREELSIVDHAAVHAFYHVQPHHIDADPEGARDPDDHPPLMGRSDAGAAGEQVEERDEQGEEGDR